MDYTILFSNGLPVKDFIGIEEYYLEIEGEVLSISFDIDEQKELGKKLTKDILENKKYEFHAFENQDGLSIWLEVNDEYYVAIENIESKFTNFFKSNLIKIYIYIKEDQAIAIQMF